jgi:hypothetical protein
MPGLCLYKRKHRYLDRPNCIRCGIVNPRWDVERCALRASDLNSTDVMRGEPCGALREAHPTVNRYGFKPHDFVEVKEVRANG